MFLGIHVDLGCVLVYRYTKEGNINELRHNSMYGYENKRNSLVYRYTRTAPRFKILHIEYSKCNLVFAKLLVLPDLMGSVNFPDPLSSYATRLR